MKFTLTYDGELHSNGNRQDKWDIRKHFHPQLKQLWKISPALIAVYDRRSVPTSGYHTIESAVDGRMSMIPHMSRRGHLIFKNVCAPFTRGERNFLPLVRESLSLKCALKITFLRREEPGRIYQGGDLDNRIKTLFDSFSIPNPDQMVKDHAFTDDPIYCLMEDDKLITGLNVQTHQLLRDGGSPLEVRLIIEVDVRAVEYRPYNQPFLGE
jgi:hypothetical protein